MVAWNPELNPQRQMSGDQLTEQVAIDALAVIAQLQGSTRKVDLERVVEVEDKRVTCRLVIEERDGVGE